MQLLLLTSSLTFEPPLPPVAPRPPLCVWQQTKADFIPCGTCSTPGAGCSCQSPGDSACLDVNVGCYTPQYPYQFDDPNYCDMKTDGQGHGCGYCESTKKCTRLTDDREDCPADGLPPPAPPSLPPPIICSDAETTCNTCPACCKDYLQNSTSCHACFEEECAGKAWPPPPPSPPSPPPCGDIESHPEALASMEGPCVLRFFPKSDTLPGIWQAWTKYPLTGYDDNVRCVMTSAHFSLDRTKPLLSATCPPALFM